MGIEETLTERETRYGSYKNHAMTTQLLKSAVQEHPNYYDMSSDKRESVEMILHKIARIINGNPDYKDNWHDIAGYATLAEKGCVEL